MAKASDYAGVAVEEAYDALKIARRDRAFSDVLIDRLIEASTRVETLLDMLEARAASVGVTHRWVDTQLQLLDEKGDWKNGPDLKGQRGQVGRWLGDVALVMARQRIETAGPTLTLDLLNYSQFDVYLAGDITEIVLLNIPDAGRTIHWAIYFWQDDTGLHSVSGWQDFVWGSGGLPPVINPSPGIGTLIIVDTPGGESDVSRGFLIDQYVAPQTGEGIIPFGQLPQGLGPTDTPMFADVALADYAPLAARLGIAGGVVPQPLGTTDSPTFANVTTGATDLNAFIAGVTSDMSALTDALADFAAELSTQTGHLATLAGNSVDAGQQTIDDSFPVTPPSDWVGPLSAGMSTTHIYNGQTPVAIKRIQFAVAASGNNALIAAVPGRILRVLAFSVQNQSVTPVTAIFKSDGATANTTISGKKILTEQGAGWAQGFNVTGWFETVLAKSLDLNLSAAAECSGEISYIEV